MHFFTFNFCNIIHWNDLYCSLDESGIKIKGVKEVFEMCMEAAKKIPQIRYIVWDVAFTEHGPLIVEGNE